MARVPTVINPRTRVAAGTLPYAQGGASPQAFGAGLARGIAQIGEDIREGQLRRQQFDVSKRYVQEIGDLQRDFETRKQNAPLGAENFTQSLDADYAARHQQLLTELYDSGIDEEIIRDTDLRLANLRSKLSAEALNFQQKSYRSKVDFDIDEANGNLEGLVFGDGQLYDGALAEQAALVDDTDLTAEEKLERKVRFQKRLQMALAAGDVQRDPQGALSRLGGNDPLTVLEATGKVTDSSLIDKVFNSLVIQESGGRPGVAGPETKYGRAYGLTQVLDETGRGVASRLGIEWKPELMRGTSKEAAEYQLKIGRGYFDEGLERYNGDLKSALKFYHGGPNENNWGPKTRRYADEILARVGDLTQKVSPEIKKQELAEIDPRYADMDLDDRLRLIGMAQRSIEQQQTVQAAVAAKEHDDWYNDFLLGLEDGTIGAADIAAARRSGRLTDFDEVTRAENILERKEKENADINFFNTAIGTPGFAWNPYDPKQVKAVEAGLKSAGGDINSAMQIWQKTGIVPPTAAIALRGGLISTDPKVFQASANVAANMLRQNPNAFAAVKGGEEMEKNALAFNHYVYDLGMSGEMASARIAQENSPEFKQRVKVGIPELEEVRQRIRKEGVDVSALVFDDAPFENAQTARGANQAYAELVVKMMQGGKDEATARSIAEKQVQKVYGVSRDGKVRKYPPEKMYPNLGEGFGYIYKQAADDVNKLFPGSKLQGEDIQLVPVPGVTDQDFRDGRPPRYKILFKRKVDGQSIWDTAPGVFVADTASEATKISNERRIQFDYERAQLPAPSLQDIQRSNPRRKGEGVFQYQLRMNELQERAVAQREAAIAAAFERTPEGQAAAKRRRTVAPSIADKPFGGF